MYRNICVDFLRKLPTEKYGVIYGIYGINRLYDSCSLMIFMRKRTRGTLLECETGVSTNKWLELGESMLRRLHDAERKVPRKLEVRWKFTSLPTCMVEVAKCTCGYFIFSHEHQMDVWPKLAHITFFLSSC